MRVAASDVDSDQGHHWRDEMDEDGKIRQPTRRPEPRGKGHAPEHQRDTQTSHPPAARSVPYQYPTIIAGQRPTKEGEDSQFRGAALDTSRSTWNGNTRNRTLWQGCLELRSKSSAVGRIWPRWEDGTARRQRQTPPVGEPRRDLGGKEGSRRSRGSRNPRAEATHRVPARANQGQHRDGRATYRGRPGKPPNTQEAVNGIRGN